MLPFSHANKNLPSSISKAHKITLHILSVQSATQKEGLLISSLPEVEGVKSTFLHQE